METNGSLLIPFFFPYTVSLNAARADSTGNAKDEILHCHRRLKALFVCPLNLLYSHLWEQRMERRWGIGTQPLVSMPQFCSSRMSVLDEWLTWHLACCILVLVLVLWSWYLRIWVSSWLETWASSCLRLSLSACREPTCCSREVLLCSDMVCWGKMTTQQYHNLSGLYSILKAIAHYANDPNGFVISLNGYCMTADRT